MTIKNDTKIEEELTCQFKSDMRNLTDFDPSTQKSQKICTLMGCFWPKYIVFELRKSIEELRLWHWILVQNLKEKWPVLSKMTLGIEQIFTRASLGSLKIGTLMGSFYPKQKMHALKIYRGVLCHDNKE